ncbi:plasmid recombination protein [Ruminococcus sp. CLA-AA-H200]|uniref:Plasmid recombination protein n=1 Tax=Ruminococcus turbiniformis TaxID=2881258 RepID=A0ABS8G163_9FIRM|nr:MobV family relaxase [Ruminococcus turbiniformis]MCC2255966.1 plasmid recombination protein [Ruminococcus turbiniformis]
MGYCFVTTEKIHDLGTLSSKDNHNNRKVSVDNADPSKADLNKVLYGNQVPFADFYRDRIAQLPYYANHRVRKGQVLAYEVVMTFSREDREHIDLDAWQKKNVEWLKKEFNKAGDGKNNIASVVYHADEPGNVHCHAIVVPIDEQGHLNASAYTNGARKMTELQNSYAEDMAEFALKRGLKGSSARHRDIKKFYADLNRAMKVPEALPGESAFAYRERVYEDIQTLQASAKKKRDTEYTQFQRRMDQERISQRNAISEEWKNAKRDMDQLVQKTQKQVLDLEQKKEQLGELVKTLENLSGKDYPEILHDLQATLRLQESIKAMRETDPDKAAELSALLEDSPQKEMDR